MALPPPQVLSLQPRSKEMSTIPSTWVLFNTLSLAQYLKDLYHEYIAHYTKSMALGTTVRPAGLSLKMHAQFEHTAKTLALAYLNPGK